MGVNTCNGPRLVHASLGITYVKYLSRDKRGQPDSIVGRQDPHVQTTSGPLYKRDVKSLDRRNSP